MKVVKIFMVEDEKLYRDVWAHFIGMLNKRLQEMQLEIEFAETGKQAMLRLNDDDLKPDIFILELILPDDIDGLKVCKAIRKIPKFQDTPILMLTSFFNDTNREQANRAGVTDFFSKGMMLADLFQYIVTTVENETI